jgi:hypothetical protein
LAKGVETGACQGTLDGRGTFRAHDVGGLGGARCDCSQRDASLQEDATVRSLVAEFGTKKWSQIAAQLPGRLGKQCRERWCVVQSLAAVLL